MSPKTATQNEEIRRQSSAKIMQAAFELFAKHGYETTSIAQIAKEAGVSKGLLYNYFSSKEDLLKSLIEQAMHEGDDLVEKLVAEDPKETLRNMFVWFRKDLVERSEQWKLMTELALQVNKFEFVQEIITVKMQQHINQTEELLTAIGFENPRHEAQLIMAMFDGLGMQYLVVKDDLAIDEITSYLIEKYCNKK